MRPDLRKARMNRRFCLSAWPKARVLLMMTAQEMTDMMSRSPSTVRAVGPLLCSMSMMALEECAEGAARLGSTEVSVVVAAS